MFKNIYQGKRVLVTGHTGFKGSWLCIWLKELGADVAGYALDPPGEPNNFSACRLSEHIDHQHGDVRDQDRLISAFSRCKPEMVFHLAAQALVRSSYDDPKETFDTNAGGTVNVLEAVRRTPGVRVLVNVTSDKCYENREWAWGYRENDPLGGHDPYSASKGCAELIFSAYLRSFFSQKKSGDTIPISILRQAQDERAKAGETIPISGEIGARPRISSNSASNSASGGRLIGAGSCRAGNAIGGGDWGRDRLIPDCVRALNAGRPVGIRNPRSVRPWQHVLELLSGYLWLGARLWEDPEGFSGVWNFGPAGADNGSVQEVVDRFIKTWGSGVWEDLSDPKAVHEAAALRLCCDKAANHLGWRNALSLEQAIDLTAEWYKMFYSGASQEDVYLLCTKQIAEYAKTARERALRWTEK
jgi:CDP-glucose 4,6-dehydratase